MIASYHWLSKFSLIQHKKAPVFIFLFSSLSHSLSFSLSLSEKQWRVMKNTLGVYCLKLAMLRWIRKLFSYLSTDRGSLTKRLS